MNRRIRNRTNGGVGAGARERPGYPIWYGTSMEAKMEAKMEAIFFTTRCDTEGYGDAW